MSKKPTITDIIHPDYQENSQDWLKWRSAYEGGQNFINRYLKRFSARESVEMYNIRKEVTYNPAFAKAAIDEIKNAVFKRLVDIEREGGDSLYNLAIDGADGGVDLIGSSMNQFIGAKVLPELLSMSRVGIFVDMPTISGETLYDAKGKRPYIYVYRTEDIRSWTLDESSEPSEFTSVLLRDYVYEYDKDTGLPIGLICRFRHMWLQDGHVRVQLYSDNGVPLNAYNHEELGGDAMDIIDLNIDKIPFIMVRLSDSLMADIANYQIALLNLGSSDLSYALQANYPFYTEQYDGRSENLHVRKPGPTTGGQEADAIAGKVEQVKVGISTGRRYPKGLERPAFIHPSAEPLKASMEKQNQLKAELRQLVHLAVSNLAPQKQQAADSKEAEDSGLEDGLAAIGLELEAMERKIGTYWSMYRKTDTPSVFYPETYRVKSAAERQLEIERLIKSLPIVPSQTFARAVLRQIAQLVLQRRVETKELDKIMKEINASEATTADPAIIVQSVTNGILNLKLAAKLLGYPENSIDLAADDHADRLARIQESQTPDNGLVNGAARGVPEKGVNSDTGSKEKEGKNRRGRGKATNNGKV